MYNENGSGYFEEEFERARRVSSVLTGVFVWMLIGLMISALTAVATLSVPAIYTVIYGSGMGYWVLIILTFVMAIAVFPRVYSMSAPMGYLTFVIYAILNGLTLSSIFLIYEIGQISLAFFSAAAMFGIMAVYGAVTKSDLSSKGSILFMGLAGIIIASVLNFLLRSSFLDTVICYAAIAIFLGLTAYDTQKIKHRAYTAPDEHALHALTILGALSLYLDFINLFLRLLRLLSRRNR